VLDEQDDGGDNEYKYYRPAVQYGRRGTARADKLGRRRRTYRMAYLEVGSWPHRVPHTDGGVD
jgi:hypothetical protein